MFTSLHPSQILRHVRDNEFQEAEDAIIEFIKFNVNELNRMTPVKSIEMNSLDHESGHQDDKIMTLEMLCNKYVNVISELFCHPNYVASNVIIGCFLGYKTALDWLFSASHLKNTDSIIEKMGLIKEESAGKLKLSTKPQDLIMTMTLISLGSKFRLPWRSLFAVNPAIALSSYIGLVTQPIPALSRENNIGFNHLLESAKDLPIFELLVVEDLGKLKHGFFNCSFATSPNKYEFKKWLTSLIRHNLTQWLDDEVKSYTANLPEYRHKKKPKMAIMLELYSRNHAMYRCFNKVFIDLSDKYQLVAFIDEKDVTDADLSVFDNVATFNDVFNINENAKRIASECPDIIFYPSIGMKFWGIYLSQLRLAPIQIMMGGHPSSSYSPEMDYVIILGNSFTISELQSFMTEKIITGDKSFREATTHTLHEALTPNFLAQNNKFLESDNEIKAGVNGVLKKVSYQLIDVCKRIQLGTSKKVTFVFFSEHQSDQLAYLAASRILASELEYFELVCYDDYIIYMTTISQCHFLLPTLPFGGANSNIDAMLLNKPKLYIRGKEQIYTRTDQWEWERIDLDNELGCDSVDELIEKSIQIIDSPVYRERLHQKLVEKCTLENICGSKNKLDSIVGDVFSKITADMTF